MLLPFTILAELYKLLYEFYITFKKSLQWNNKFNTIQFTNNAGFSSFRMTSCWRSCLRRKTRWGCSLTWRSASKESTGCSSPARWRSLGWPARKTRRFPSCTSCTRRKLMFVRSNVNLCEIVWFFLLLSSLLVLVNYN